MRSRQIQSATRTAAALLVLSAPAASAEADAADAPTRTTASPVLLEGSTDVGSGRLIQVSVGDSGSRSSVVARTTTDSHGRFRVVATGLSELARHATSDGLVNLTVLAPISGGGVETHHVVAHIGKASSPRLTQTLILDRSTAGTGAAAARPSRVSAPTAATDGIPTEVPLRTVAAASPVARASSGPASPTDDFYACKTTWVKYMGSRKVFIAGVYSASPTSATIKASFLTGRSTKVGVGVSVDGTFGTYSVKGERAVERTATEDHGVHRGTKHLYTDFGFSKYKVRCTYGGVETSRRYEIRATSHDGGPTTGRTSTPSLWKCKQYPKNKGITLDSSRAWRNYYGADLKGAIGVNLSAETGYVTGSSLQYNATASRGARLCGDDTYPASGPRRIVVRKAL
ncbi:hypothetical protein L6241_05960 [Janibacter sp. Y6]|uniref:hypothetical protein n=1 Tax=Janibacter sp. Y6 TaxID=2913552 RepID=UPI0034A58F32